MLKYLKSLSLVGLLLSSSCLKASTTLDENEETLRNSSDYTSSYKFEESIKGTLQAITFSWSESQKITEEKYQSLYRAIEQSSTDDKAITTVINYFVEGECPQEDIEDMMQRAGIFIPSKAYTDWGLHEFLFGKKSMLGSPFSLIKGFYKSPFSWINRYFSTFLGYTTTFMMMSNFVTSVGATDTSCVDGHCTLPSSDSCLTPQGPYSESCYNIKVEPYMSSDPHVPDSCVLTTECAKTHTSMKPDFNEVYFPTHTQLEGIGNNNGTLTYEGLPFIHKLNEQTSGLESSSDLCFTPFGSYQQTCTVQTEKYVSSDPNLRFTKLCKATAKCETLQEGQETTTTVYYDLRDSQQNLAQKIENCDGRLKIGSNDHECQVTDVDTIKKIAKESGQVEVKL